MKNLKWLLVGLLAVFLGVLYVQFLSVHPLQMSLYLLATCVVLFLLGRSHQSWVQRESPPGCHPALSASILCRTIRDD